MIRHFFLLFLICTSGLSVFAQNDDVCISADRPGMATGVDVMPCGKVQIETGLEFDYGDEKSIALPTTMLRVGLFSFAELRLQYDGTLIKESDVVTGNKSWKYHVQPITAGTKIHLYEGLKWIPELSFLANVTIPYTNEHRDCNTKVASQFYLLCHNNVNDLLSLDYNAGMEWNGCGDNPSTFLALCLGFNLNDRVGAFAESYNYFKKVDDKTELTPNIDLGFTYILDNNIQFDVYTGFDCKKPSSSYFIGCGFAWRIN